MNSNKPMSPRERVLTTLARREPDRVPKMLGFFPISLPQTSPQEPEDYFEMEIRFAEFEPPPQQDNFIRFLENLPVEVRIGDVRALQTYHEWGYHPEIEGLRPLLSAKTVEELSAYPLPDTTAEYRYRGLHQKVQAWQARGLAVMGSPPHLGGELFETAWRLRGFETFLTDLILNKELASYLLDQITEMAVHSCIILAQAGVDILALDDDVGMPTMMIISPETWREFLKPRLARIIQLARAAKPDIFVFYHSDGYIEPIIPDLIEIGVDVLNPVQPDVMDPAKLKAEYGDRLAFWGTVGTATTWAWGTPEEIRREVRERIETVGKGGGLIISPAYDIEPDVPWENIVAFFEAVEEFGVY